MFSPVLTSLELRLKSNSKNPRKLKYTRPKSIFPQDMRNDAIVDSFLKVDNRPRDERIREIYEQIVEIYADMDFYVTTEYQELINKHKSSDPGQIEKIQIYLYLVHPFSDQRIADLDTKLETVKNKGDTALRLLRMNIDDRRRVQIAFEAEDCVGTGETSISKTFLMLPMMRDWRASRNAQGFPHENLHVLKVLS